MAMRLSGDEKLLRTGGIAWHYCPQRDLIIWKGQWSHECSHQERQKKDA